MAQGRFITFEGGEGAGKSTQIARLARRLTERGLDVVVTREPGGSERAERIRSTVLQGAAKALGPFAEALMFSAARRDHLDKTIRPALARGAVVLCDRFSDSTRAYQGADGGAEPGLIDALERVVVEETRPDLTLVLDLPAQEGLARAARRR
ncbi:MAG TPA: dTMP kinase, partial [Beijerinckiaceae bacterium]|nr:dTMP kinase [Beijerinckiaceae bacterium]